MSRSKAINNFCRFCIVDPHEKGLGTWRQQVEGCTASDCPLFEYRPLPSGSKARGKRQKAEKEPTRDQSKDGGEA